MRFVDEHERAMADDPVRLAQRDRRCLWTWIAVAVWAAAMVEVWWWIG